MSEERAITIYQPAMMPAMRIEEAVERFQALATFTSQIMTEGTDYGVIPGTTKKTLLKPGAEKLTTFFGLSVRFVTQEAVEDWIGKDHGGEAFFYYWFRCQLHRGDLLIAEADGSCNSWETKYRYRQAERICPVCGIAAIIKGKKDFGGGWVCWNKKGGCNAKFKDDDPAITGQEVGRVTNPDPADLVNTIKKMAQKRALVAATLVAVNASEYFTQDVEDFEHEAGIEGSKTISHIPQKPEESTVVKCPLCKAVNHAPWCVPGPEGTRIDTRKQKGG